MKRFMLTIILLYSLTAYSQSIQQNELDKFTKQRRVETSQEAVISTFFDKLRVKLRAVDTTYFAMFSGSGAGVGVIGPKDAMIILLDNDSTVRIYPTGVFSYDIGQYGNTYEGHQYAIQEADLLTLRMHEIKSIRVYTSKGYADMDATKKTKATMQKLVDLFLKTLGR